MIFSRSIPLLLGLPFLAGGSGCASQDTVDIASQTPPEGNGGGSGECDELAPVTNFDEFIQSLARFSCAPGSDYVAGCSMLDAAWCEQQLATVFAAFYEGRRDHFDLTGASACLREACQRDPISVACLNFSHTGAVPPGGACQHTVDCGPPMGDAFADCLATASPDGASSVRRCQAIRRGRAGDACLQGLGATTEVATCFPQDGLSCDEKKGVCKPRPIVGGDCYSGADCVDSWCSFGQAGPGTCLARIPVGGACDPGECVPGAYCEQKTCVASKKTGQSCHGSSVTECTSGLCVYGRCSEPLVCAPAQAPDPVAQFEKAFREAKCTVQIGCCAVIGIPVKQADSCEQAIRLNSPVPDGALIFDEAMAKACLEQVKVGHCDDFFSDGAERLSQTNPCERVYTTGKEALIGEACDSVADCAAGMAGRVNCSPLDGSWRCTLLQAGKLGEACNTVVKGVRTVCEPADSLQCDPSTGQCMSAVVAVNCGAGVTCLSSQFCDPTTVSCQDLHPPGAACTSDQQCTSSRCTDGICETSVWYGTCF